jgi:S-adenosylmethionine hydrolase
MLENPIITLTTDFGLKDPFVGLMKGVILGINPHVKLVNISHNIQRHNIFEASQVLAMSYKFFPPTTIHLAVVDPGVGGNRRPILVVTENYYFIGPDNGIFSPIYEQSESHFFKVIHITASHYFRQMKGSTFHGRDIFSPVAAWLSKGMDSHKFGEEIFDFVKIPTPKPSLTSNTISGEIISFDNFGNSISNITVDDLASIGPVESTNKFKVTFGNQEVPLVKFYAENENQNLSAIINSFGYLELFVFQGSASEKFDIKLGDSVTISPI